MRDGAKSGGVRAFGLVAFLSLAIGPTVLAQTCPLTIVGGVVTPGGPRRIAVSGNHVYSADRFDGLQVIDASTPSAPVIVGSVPVSSFAFDVVVDGTVAYIADRFAGLTIVDVSNPAAPAIIANIDTPDQALGVVVSGPRAYVADNTSGLQIFDITNPAIPGFLGSVSGTGLFVNSVAVSGTTAYISGRNANTASGFFHVIDVSDPANAFVIGTVSTPGFGFTIELSGSIAYVADGIGGLQVIDISNSASPTIIGSFATPTDAESVSVDGPRAFVASSTSGLIVVDISNPTAPVPIGTILTPNTAFDVEIQAAQAFVADIDGGVQIIDVSACAAASTSTALCPLALIGTASGQFSQSQDVAVQGALAYVADGFSGLQIVDVTDPSLPALLGSLDTFGFVNSVAASGNTAYVTNQSKGDEVIVVDATNPALPVRLGSVFTSGSANAIAVTGNLALVADGFAGLTVVDVTDPALPSVVGSVNTPGIAVDVAAAGSLAFVADLFGGVQVIDVSNPALPVIIGSTFTNGDAEAIAVDGSFAYVADPNISESRGGVPGLQVIDVSAPANPVIVGTLSSRPPGFGEVDVAVSEGIVFYTFEFGPFEDLGRVFAIDARDPTNPTMAGSLAPGGPPLGVAARGGTAYVPAGGSGLRIVDASGCLLFEPQQFPLPGPATSIDSGDLGSDPQGPGAGAPDGLPDLAMTIPDEVNPTTAPGRAVILFNLGNDLAGNWQGFGALTELTVGFDPSAIGIGELNGDGLNDLLITNRADNSVTPILNDGVGFSLGGIVEPPIPVGTAPSAVALANLNVDPRDDAAVANQGDSTITILTIPTVAGSRQFGLTPSSTEITGNTPTSVTVTNSDNDKWDDIVSSNFNGSPGFLRGSTGSISVLRNTGPGLDGNPVFQPHVELSVGAGPRQAITADLDLDLDEEIVTANEFGQSITILVNNTTSGVIDYSPRLDFPVGGTASSLAAIDIDLDGDTDIAIIVSNPATGPLGSRNIVNSIMILRNELQDSTGGFPDFTLIPNPIETGANPQFVIGSDVSPSPGVEIVTTSVEPTVTISERVPAISTIECAAGVVIVLSPPDEDVEQIDLAAVLGITDANGDPVDIQVLSITQDEPFRDDDDDEDDDHDDDDHEDDDHDDDDHDDDHDDLGIGGQEFGPWSNAAIGPNGGSNASSNEPEFEIPCDAEIGRNGVILIRRDRDPLLNGRVYEVSYVATSLDGESCQNTVEIQVPLDEFSGPAINDGQLFDSTMCTHMGDVDSDGLVGFQDLLAVLTDWGRTYNPIGTVRLPTDIDVSGTVDFGDVALILANWMK